jgi:hypothetical protein
VRFCNFEEKNIFENAFNFLENPNVAGLFRRVMACLAIACLQYMDYSCTACVAATCRRRMEYVLHD